MCLVIQEMKLSKTSNRYIVYASSKNTELGKAETNKVLTILAFEFFMALKI